MQFVENYVQRYGSPHPEFFIGSLEEAMNEACQKRISQVSLLVFSLIYFHIFLTCKLVRICRF